MKPTPLEKDILGWYRDNCEMPGLAEQLAAAVPTKREHTGVGFYLYLSLPVDFKGPAVPANANPLSGPEITIPGVDPGAGAVLFFADGKLDFLEVFSYGDSFPEMVDEYNLNDRGGTSASGDETPSGANKPPPDELEARRRWFDEYCKRLDEESVYAEPQEGVVHPCPCCYCLTLTMRGGFEICPVCYWEDDGQDNHDADLVRGGPNGEPSLTRARNNYARIGACDEGSRAHVRDPLPDELPTKREG